MNATTCPKCGGTMENDGSLIGQTVACPFCSHSFIMPFPSAAAPASAGSRIPAETLPGMEQATPLPSAASSGNPWSSSPGNPMNGAAGIGSLSGAPAASPGLVTCPYCRAQTRPVVQSQMSSAGLVVMILMLFFCLPLFWIGFLIKEDTHHCRACGMKLQ